jgi:hypothetical protein
MERTSKQFPKKKVAPIERPVQISEATSAEIKQSFAKLWLKEEQYRKYVYEVERCDNGARVFLHRPTYKHGLDFAVSVEGFRSQLRKGKRRRKSKSPRPSHGDIIKDLKDKIKSRPKLTKDLFGAVSAIYRCVEPGAVLNKHTKLKTFRSGLPIDHTLRIIKWLFIEQDVTYWLGTGRNMLMSAIERRAFKIKDSKLFE